MNIDFQNLSILYPIFFTLAHLASWCILIGYGIRHKFPKLQWLLIIATGYIFFTLGSQLFAITLDSLKGLFVAGTWPASSGKSFISGLLLAVPAMLVVKRLAGFKLSIFEPYALSIPIGLAIQRIGCLAAGCCFGNPSNLPWAVSYGHGHSIHYTQYNQGIITSAAANSIPLHPVQVYESVLCLLIAITIIYLYKRKQFQGQLIYIFLLLYSIVRFILEFFRADQAHTIGLNSFLGINTVQWIMLVLGISITLFLYFRLPIKEHRKVFNPLPDRPVIVELIGYLMLFVVVLLTSKFYYPLEHFLLGLILTPVSALFLWRVFSIITIPKLRLATVSLCVIGLFLMSQSTVDDKKEIYPKSYHIFSLGGNLGFDNMTSYRQSCDGTKTEQFEFEENYYLIGGGYQYQKQYSESKRLTLGISGSYGAIQESITDLRDFLSDFPGNYKPEKELINYEISPFVKYDDRIFGIGLGGVIGNFNVFRQPHQDMYLNSSDPESMPFSSNRTYKFLPSLHLRFGNMNNWWAEFNYGNRFPGISPANEYDILIGIRGEHGNLVRLGTSAHHALVVRPTFYIGKTLSLDPYVGLGGALFSNAYMNRFGMQGGINVHYRFESKKKKK